MVTDIFGSLGASNFVVLSQRSLRRKQNVRQHQDSAPTYMNSSIVESPKGFTVRCRLENEMVALTQAVRSAVPWMACGNEGFPSIRVAKAGLGALGPCEPCNEVGTVSFRSNSCRCPRENTAQGRHSSGDGLPYASAFPCTRRVPGFGVFELRAISPHWEFDSHPGHFLSS